MMLRREITSMIILGLLCFGAWYLLPQHPELIATYDRSVYYPFQAARGWLFGIIPFSAGDIFYLSAGLTALVLIIKWIYWLFSLREHKYRLLFSVLTTINTCLFLYLFFILGWGANYYKKPLRAAWGLQPDTTALKRLSKDELKLKIKKDIIAFDTLLIKRLNDCAPHYRTIPVEQVNKQVVRYYHALTNCKLEHYGLGVKSTFFSYWLQRVAIEGYYNPFTGEGQIDGTLPSFLMPFLISHEIAHQAGIAAEGDANLMAYALCTAADDSNFRYSAYFEIWLYINRRLYFRDSALARTYENQLNKLTRAHLDTLEQIDKKYDNDVARYSAKLYDQYLKMQDQKDGIRSYGSVSSSAWELEKRRATGVMTRIEIP